MRTTGETTPREHPITRAVRQAKEQAALEVCCRFCGRLASDGFCEGCEKGRAAYAAASNIQAAWAAR
jgi:hypothetical protein